MAGTYEPVPTDDEQLEDNQHTRDFTPAETRLHLPSFRKLFAFALAFCLVAVISYKAGQWSVEHSTDPAPIVHEPEGDTETKPPGNGTDMPGTGKYSVG